MYHCGAGENLHTPWTDRVTNRDVLVHTKSNIVRHRSQNSETTTDLIWSCRACKFTREGKCARKC